MYVQSVCCLSYPACNAIAPYCHLWPVRLCSIIPHCLIIGAIFGERIMEHNMCVMILSAIFCETFLILRRIEREMTKNVYRSSCKVPVFWGSDFNASWNFSTDFRKIPISNFMKIRSVGTELFHAGGRTDGRRHFEVTFRNFANAPKNGAMRRRGWCRLSAEGRSSTFCSSQLLVFREVQ